MPRIFTKTTLGLLSICFPFTLLFAQPEDVTTFSMPSIKEEVIPTYPYRAANNAKEGFVEINYMVDTDGKAFDPIVTYSVGDEAFQKEAIRSIEKSTFEPAMLNGEPIVGSSTRRFKFKMDVEYAQATYKFINRFNKFKEVLANNNQEEIWQELDKLEDVGSNNFYEDAYLNLARFEFELRYGNERKQMEHLHAALSNSNNPDDPTFFEKETVTQLRRTLLPLQINNNFFIEAMFTYSLMIREEDSEAVEFYKDAIDSVRKLRLDDTEFAIPFSLNDKGFVFAQLLKNKVYLSGGSGKLEEIRLNCEKQHVSFSAEKDFSYEIPQSWGFCLMSVIGDPEASFNLIQH